MHIRIIAVGRLKERYLADGVAEYVLRIKPYARLEIVEVADEPFSGRPAEAERRRVREREAALIRRRIPQGSYVLALDPGGRTVTSEEFASLFSDAALAGRSDFSLLIGGALGLDRSLLQCADQIVSFSRMTFPHQLFRLMLVEQVYRAFKIMRGEPYHW